MLFSTPSQFAVLLLMLVVGWLFGLASHPGGRKWKQAYRDEQAARDALEKRNAELSAELERTRTTRPSAPVAASAARPAAVRASTRPADKRGWFDWDR